MARKIELDKVLDKDEKVFWQGGPKFWPFFLGSLPSAIFGLIFMVILIPFMLVFVTIGSKLGPLFGGAFFLLPHFWIALGLIFGGPIYRILVHRRTYYAITDKRVIIQKGVIGRDFNIIDFDQIGGTQVDVSILDKLFGNSSGSIIIGTAGYPVISTAATRRLGLGNVLQNIEDPYNTVKFLKKVSYDVKTDIQYPNALRPSENPGYTSSYKPDQK